MTDNKRKIGYSIAIITFAIMLFGFSGIIITDGSETTSDPVYVDGVSGDDNNDGSSTTSPVKTLTRALELVTAGGVIIVMSDVTDGNENTTMPGLWIDKSVTIKALEGLVDRPTLTIPGGGPTLFSRNISMYIGVTDQTDGMPERLEVVLQGIRIDNSGPYIGASYGVTVGSPTDLAVIDCDIAGLSAINIVAEDVDHPALQKATYLNGAMGSTLVVEDSILSGNKTDTGGLAMYGAIIVYCEDVTVDLIGDTKISKGVANSYEVAIHGGYGTAGWDTKNLRVRIADSVRLNAPIYSMADYKGYSEKELGQGEAMMIEVGGRTIDVTTEAAFTCHDMATEEESHTIIWTDSVRYAEFSWDTGISYVDIKGDVSLNESMTIGNSHGKPMFTVKGGAVFTIPSGITLSLQGTGTSLTVDGKVVVDGTLTCAVPFINYGTVGLNGTMTNDGTFANIGMVGNEGTLTNNGTFNNGGTIENSGTLDNRSVFANSGLIINQDTISGWEQSGSVLNLAVSPAIGGTIAYEITGTTVMVTAIPGEDHMFSEWTDGISIDPSIQKSIHVLSPLSWTAVFDLAVTATFDSQGGSPVDEQTVEFNTQFIEPADPTRDGYTFGGWYTTDTFSVQYEFSAAAVSDITLYAKWDVIPSFTVTFHANGEVYSIEHVYPGHSATRPVTDPVQEGMSFAGWMTTDGGSEKYAFNSIVESDQNIYAGWNNTIAVSIPPGSEELGFTATNSGTTIHEAGSEIGFDVTTLADFTATVSYGSEIHQQEAGTTVHYVISGYMVNISVTVETVDTRTSTVNKEIQNVEENEDTTVTEEIGYISIDTEHSSAHIEEVAEVLTEIGGETISTTTTIVDYTISDTEETVVIDVVTDSEEATLTDKMTEEISHLLNPDVDTKIVLEVEPESITVPSFVFTDTNVTSLKMIVNLGSDKETSMITPIYFLSDMDAHVTLHIASASKEAPSEVIGSSKIASSFDLVVTGAEPVFNKDMMISQKVALPSDADWKSIRVYSVDNDETIDAVCDGDCISFYAPCTSTYVMLYDVAGGHGGEDFSQWTMIIAAAAVMTTMIVVIAFLVFHRR